MLKLLSMQLKAMDKFAHFQDTGDEFYLMEDKKLLCKADYDSAKAKGTQPFKIFVIYGQNICQILSKYLSHLCKNICHIFFKIFVTYLTKLCKTDYDSVKAKGIPHPSHSI